MATLGSSEALHFSVYFPGCDTLSVVCVAHRRGADSAVTHSGLGVLPYKSESRPHLAPHWNLERCRGSRNRRRINFKRNFSCLLSTDFEESSWTFFDRLPPRPEVARRAIHAITPHGLRTFLDVCMCSTTERGITLNFESTIAVDLFIIMYSTQLKGEDCICMAMITSVW